MLVSTVDWPEVCVTMVADAHDGLVISVCVAMATGIYGGPNRSMCVRVAMVDQPDVCVCSYGTVDLPDVCMCVCNYSGSARCVCV